MTFDIKNACSVIKKFNYKTVTLQFPDELANECVDIYSQMSQQLDPDISLFISIDSTYGSSVDDVSAMHVDSDFLIQFGSDLSCSGSIPVMLLPPIKEFDESILLNTLNKLISTSITSNTPSHILILYDPSYYHHLIKFQQNQHDSTLSYSNIDIAKLPSYANSLDWSPHGSYQLSSSETLIGGLICPQVLLHTNDSTANQDTTYTYSIVYIGDKKEQLSNIYLYLSSYHITSYSPQTGDIKQHIGCNTFDFRERTGGMLRVSESRIIGLIIGSMGLTAHTTQSIIHRLQTLIKESGRKYYTFAMGRLNEAKLSNFPEIDLFCLIGNDDHSVIPAKTFHVPVITPWELELGLGAREWVSVFKSSSGSIIDDEEVPLALAIERVQANRVNNNIDDSDNEDKEEHDDEEKEEKIPIEQDVTQNDITNLTLNDMKNSMISNSDNNNNNNNDNQKSTSVLKNIQALIKKNMNQELMIVEDIGTDYYKQREYKGLEMTITEERNQDYTVHEGRSGLPIYSYRNTIPTQDTVQDGESIIKSIEENQDNRNKNDKENSGSLK